MSLLKLGKLPDREMTKITIAVSAELNAELAGYAKAYEKEYNKTEKVEELIPHMLEAFIKSDRGFRKLVAESTTARNGDKGQVF